METVDHRLKLYLRTSKGNLIRRCAKIAKRTDGSKLDLARRIVTKERQRWVSL